MKDPHLGTFGLAGGVLLLLGKFAALAEVMRWPDRGPWVIGGAVAAARCLALCVAALGRYPRPEGTGKALIESVRPAEGLLFGALGLGLAFGAGAGTPGALGWFACAAAGVLLLAWICRARLGGVTGDCLGACIEFAELLFLLAAVMLSF
jgi:adenosylcobinamide-GDP ribazoletransferase